MYQLTPIDWFKAALVLGAAGVLGWRAWRGATRPHGRSTRFPREALMVVVLLLLGFGVWGATRYTSNWLVKTWDVFHYYLGSKYFAELDYTGLYDCTLQADIEDGVAGDLRQRNLRNLRTNRLESALAAASDPDRCIRRFSADRWSSFKADLAWFRARMPAGHWSSVLMDHGYNATPVWNVIGTVLTSTGRASDLQLALLVALDPLLLLLMWGVVTWAFGWRIALFSFVFWATFYPSRLAWLWGAFLRQEWLALSVVAICMARRGRATIAGFCLGTATLTRVFPGLLLAGAGLAALARLIGGQRPWLGRDLKRLAAGSILALTFWIPLSLANGGLSGWSAFAQNIRRHTDTPALNTMGLKTVASYSPASRARLLKDTRQRDAFAGWRQARREVFSKRKPLYLTLILVFIGFFAWSVRRQPLWHTLALAAGLVPFVGEFACYYYAILLCFCLILRHRPGAVVGLFGLSALTWATVAITPYKDEHFSWASAALLVYVVWLVLDSSSAVGDSREQGTPGKKGAESPNPATE